MPKPSRSASDRPPSAIAPAIALLAALASAIGGPAPRAIAGPPVAAPRAQIPRAQFYPDEYAPPGSPYSNEFQNDPILEWERWVALGSEAEARGDYGAAIGHYGRARQAANRIENPDTRRCFQLDTDARSAGARSGQQFLNSQGFSTTNLDRASQTAQLTYQATAERLLGSAFDRGCR